RQGRRGRLRRGGPRRSPRRAVGLLHHASDAVDVPRCARGGRSDGGVLVLRPHAICGSLLGRAAGLRRTSRDDERLCRPAGQRRLHDRFCYRTRIARVQSHRLGRLVATARCPHAGHCHLLDHPARGLTAPRIGPRRSTRRSPRRWILSFKAERRKELVHGFPSATPLERAHTLSANARDQCAAACQEPPVPTLTSSGTSSSNADPISSVTILVTSSTSPGWTSTMISSWTCRSIGECSSSRREATLSMAIFMMSAAEPWIGALSAARSAMSRSCRRSLCRAGRYRRRPMMVSVYPLARA